MRPYLFSSIGSLFVACGIMAYDKHLSQLYTQSQQLSEISFVLSVLIPLLILLTAKNILSLCLGQDALLFAYRRLKQGG